MAKKQEAQLILKIKTVGKKSITGLGKLWSEFTDRFVITAGDVVNGLVSVGKAIGEMALDAAKFDDVARAFKNLSAAQGQSAGEMLAQMRELSAGTVSDLELMQQANNALLLGLPVERFGDMLKIARSAAKSTGQSMEFMLQSITTGLGRQSRLMLDNLGILVNQNKAQEEYARKIGTTASKLTEAQRKQAFLNEALRVGLQNTKNAGGMTDTLSDSWQRLKSSASNLAIKIGNVLSPAFKVFVDLANDATEALKDLFDENKNLKNFKKELEGLEKSQKSLNRELEMSRRSNNAVYGAASAARIRQKIADINEEIEAVKGKITAEEEVLKKNKDAASEQERLKAAALEQEKIQEESAKALKIENEALFRQAMRDLDNEESIKDIDQKIVNAETLAEAENLVSQKKALKEKLIFEQRVKNDAKFQADKKKILDKADADAEKARKDAASKQLAFETTVGNARISLAQNIANFMNTAAGKQTLIGFLMSKAAAIGQVAISRGLALAAVPAQTAHIPYPGNLAAAGQMTSLINANAAVQAAAIAASVFNPPQLAEGGIVQARQGGTGVILGEGGQDEAVVPLGEGGLAGNTYIFNGPIMGDESQAKEFAVMIDGELLKLRLNNEAVSFDEDSF